MKPLHSPSICTDHSSSLVTISDCDQSREESSLLRPGSLLRPAVHATQPTPAHDTPIVPLAGAVLQPAAGGGVAPAAPPPAAMSNGHAVTVDDLPGPVLELVFARACATGGQGRYRHNPSIPLVCKRWADVYSKVRLTSPTFYRNLIEFSNRAAPLAPYSPTQQPSASPLPSPDPLPELGAVGRPPDRLDGGACAKLPAGGSPQLGGRGALGARAPARLPPADLQRMVEL